MKNELKTPQQIPMREKNVLKSFDYSENKNWLRKLQVINRKWTSILIEAACIKDISKVQPTMKDNKAIFSGSIDRYSCSIDLKRSHLEFKG